MSITCDIHKKCNHCKSDNKVAAKFYTCLTEEIRNVTGMLIVVISWTFSVTGNDG